MNLHYTYFLILAGALLGPLLLSFDRRVAFYKTWRYLFPAMILPALFYIVWDILFTSIGVWSFNPKYITGVKLINLPVEEVLFFFVVPYCCCFIYACIKNYFPKIRSTRVSDFILVLIGIFVFILALFFRNELYPFYTGMFLMLFIFLLMVFRKYFSSFNSATFLVSFAIIIIPFMIINGFLTALPVVIYNDSENSGVRITTIPVEDIFYGMLLILMNVVLYEKFMQKHYTG